MGFERVSHFGICVSDMEASLRFYRDVLGFREQYWYDIGPEFGGLMELDGVHGKSVFLERDGVRVELLAYEHPTTPPGTAARPMNQLGFSHMGMRVNDLPALVERLEAEGVNVLRHTRLTLPSPDGGDGPAREWVFVTDPDGVRIELIDLPAGSTPAVPATSG